MSIRFHWFAADRARWSGTEERTSRWRYPMARRWATWNGSPYGATNSPWVRTVSCSWPSVSLRFHLHAAREPVSFLCRATFTLVKFVTAPRGIESNCLQLAPSHTTNYVPPRQITPDRLARENVFECKRPIGNPITILRITLKGVCARLWITGIFMRNSVQSVKG